LAIRGVFWQSNLSLALVLSSGKSFNLAIPFISGNSFYPLAIILTRHFVLFFGKCSNLAIHFFSWQFMVSSGNSFLFWQCVLMGVLNDLRFNGVFLCMRGID
jgi:hypothetical protein